MKQTSAVNTNDIYKDEKCLGLSEFGKDYILSEEEKEELTTPQGYDDEAILEEDFFLEAMAKGANKK